MPSMRKFFKRGKVQKPGTIFNFGKGGAVESLGGAIAGMVPWAWDSVASDAVNSIGANA